MTAPDLEVYLGDADLTESLHDDVRRGLTATPKWLPPKWFYDARGSELFEEITHLPEYYPTRVERSVLAEHAADVANVTGAKTLIELGSGSSEKTRLLLDALRRNGTLATFVALDVSASALTEAIRGINAEYPNLVVHGIVGDFTKHLQHLPRGGTRLIAFLGGTIGNLLPRERARFFDALRGALEPGDWLLLGADLVKDPDVLVPAYDDAAGITAEFNRNVLHVLNERLGADFDLDAFEHVAVWDPDREWIEMRLRADHAMHVQVHDLDLDVDFAAGEELRTEVSAKFRRSGLERELADAGFVVSGWWTDPDGLFSETLAEVAD